MRGLLPAVGLGFAICIAAGPGAAWAGEATPNWAGPYVGAHVGYGWNHTDYTSALYLPSPYGTQTGPSGSIEQSGLLGGVQAGYDFQAGQVVLGGVIDISGANVTGSAIPDPQNDPDKNSVLTSTMDWLSTVRGRVGYAFGNYLIYATGGLAMAHATAHDTKIEPGLGFNDGGGDTTYFGATGGVGGEVMVGNGLSLFAQYLYVGLNTGSITFSPAPLVGTNTTSVNLVEVGLNKKF